MRATLDHALLFIRSVSDTAHRCGYMLALYGSTVTNGDGKDVDALAVPWRPADYGELLAALKVRGYSEVGERYFGSMGTCAVVLSWRDEGPVIDLQIREVESRA